jgi:hypothetical protein
MAPIPPRASELTKILSIATKVGDAPTDPPARRVDARWEIVRLRQRRIADLGDTRSRHARKTAAA